MDHQIRSLPVVTLLCVFSTLVTAQWNETNGPEGGYVTSFAWHDSSLFAGTSGGVYVSNDSGAHWTAVNYGLANLDIKFLASFNCGLFAGATSGIGSQLFRTTNDGQSWAPSSSGMPDEWGVGPIASVTDTDGNATLFAGVSGYGIYVSVDSGAHWSIDTAGLINKFVRSIVVIDTTIIVGSVGVYRSTINSRVWTPTSTDQIEHSAISSLALRDTILFVSGSGGGIDPWGVFRSTDYGASWVHVADGLTNPKIQTLAVLGNTIFAGTSDGLIFRSTNDGDHWSLCDTLPLGISVNILYAAGNNIYAGTKGLGVYVSSDSGAHWAQNNSGMKNSRVSAIAVIDSTIFAAAPIVGVFRSTDGGSTWTLINDGFYGSEVGGLAVKDSNLYAGVLQGGLFELPKDSNEWHRIGTDIVELNIAYAVIVKDTSLFVGTKGGGGVYRSNKDVTSWTQINNGILNKNINCFAVQEGDIFAGTGIGVIRSTDDGANWQYVNDGLTDVSIVALTSDGTNLYAKTKYSGIFYSTDRGYHWATIDSGFTSSDILSLGANRTTIYAGTANEGVVYTTMSDLTSAPNDPPAQPDKFTLSQNYPNPFNPSTTISFSIPRRSHITLKIFDLLGKEIATVVSEELPAGSYSRRWNAGGFSSGVYFYRLQTGTFVETKKLVVLK